MRASNSNATQEYSRFKDDELRDVYDRIEFLASKLLGIMITSSFVILWAITTGCTQFIGYKRKKLWEDKAYGHARKICRSYT
ncbi:MAG: hypothetical protein WCE81_10460 [Halobacteriota archaeon]